MTHNNSSSVSFNGLISNDNERFIWAVWLIVIFLSSLCGDTTILVASIKFKAFKLNKAMVVFIQHIAACDLLIAVLTILPHTVTLIANRWVLGTTFCYVSAYVAYFGQCAAVILICAMSLTKLLILKYPVKARYWSRKQVHLICASLWTFSLSSICILILVDRDDVSLNGNRYKCSYKFSANVWRWLNPVIYSLYVFIPTVATIIVSVLLVKHLRNARHTSRRSSGKVRWQGIATVVITASIYCISFFPESLNLLIKPYLGDSLHRLFFSRAAITFTYLNVACNVFIYTLTVPSFRNFIQSTFRQMGAAICSRRIAHPGTYLCCIVV